jgi:hypothetical protein
MVFIVAYQIAGITVKVQNLVKNHFIYLFPACLVVDGDMCLEGDVEKKTFRVDRFRRLRLLLMLFEIILGREPETNIVVSISLLLYRLLPTTSANNPPLVFFFIQPTSKAALPILISFAYGSLPSQ